MIEKHFPGYSDGKEVACNEGDLGLSSGSGSFPAEGMATHASVLAWRIPWTEEPGGLQSMGSQRVRHDRLAKHTHLKLGPLLKPLFS